MFHYIILADLQFQSFYLKSHGQMALSAYEESKENSQLESNICPFFVL